MLASEGMNMPFSELPLATEQPQSDTFFMDDSAEKYDIELAMALTQCWTPQGRVCSFDNTPLSSPRSMASGSDWGVLRVDGQLGFGDDVPLTATQTHELMSRDLTPEDYETLLLLDIGVQKNQTLDLEAVAKLPSAKAGGTWVGEACSICLSEMACDDDICALPSCDHCFHAQCAARWLSSAKATCPLCGTEVLEHFMRVAPVGESDSLCSTDTPCSSMVSTPR
jgi:hypothetical protein